MLFHEPTLNDIASAYLTMNWVEKKPNNTLK